MNQSEIIARIDQLKKDIKDIERNELYKKSVNPFHKSLQFEKLNKLRSELIDLLGKRIHHLTTIIIANDVETDFKELPDSDPRKQDYITG